MPAVSPAAAAAQEGLLVFSGMYGSAWRDGKLLADVIECSGAVEINRVDVPMVGTERLGHKPGRQTREGVMRVQKRDASWETEVYNFLSQSLDERRAARDAGKAQMRPFSLVLEYDDPYALGRERWQLDGVLIWRLPMGFSIGDDQVEREFPITWETERPLETFRREVGPGGVSVPSYYEGPVP
jgi:hypothetical protein